MAEPSGEKHHGFTNAIVKIFLESDLSLILILLAVLIGAAALWITPREEDPQIVVPLADVLVSAPGHSAQEVEQLVTTPLERILYQIDGVEYVYSTSRTNQAVITVRFYVGQDRERSLVKIIKKLNENVDLVPPAVKNWVVKPVEIDDVPVVTLTLTSPTADSYTLRRVAEEAVERLAAAPEVSRAYVVGGEPRAVEVKLDPDRMKGYHVSPLEVQQAMAGANVTANAGAFTRGDKRVEVEAGRAYARPEELRELVVGVFKDRPVFLKDVATLRDGPREATSYVRHTWGRARGFEAHEGATGTLIGRESGDREIGRSGDLKNEDEVSSNHRITGSPDHQINKSAAGQGSTPAVTIAVAKKKGSNAVGVADEVLKLAGELKGTVIPDNIEMVVTRNNGLNANEKVSELVEGLAVAVLIVIGLLTLGLGWREALIVAVAVPVVFGLTLGVNLLAGYTINRVTLFALILALGLLVDDPIVDVENIARHFHLRKKASRGIVLEAVAEIRPPLISATLAVIVSFLPMFFITGMMGPYMAPMALNVPVAMLMSMVVAFTITPWLSYHLLKKEVGSAQSGDRVIGGSGDLQSEDIDTSNHQITRSPDHPINKSVIRWLIRPLLSSRWAAAGFLAVIGGLTLGAMMLAADRSVPLKMLPFDNKNELLLVLDLDRGTTLERTDAAVRDFERYLAGVGEVTNFTSYVGVPGPVDFNGLVRHYYQRQGDHLAEIRVNLVAKKNRSLQSHGLGLRMRDELTAIAAKHHARLKIVELPPGPPVISTVTAEVYGRPDHRYEDLVSAARTVESRLKAEPGVVDVDSTIEADADKLTFVADKEKAALAGVSVAQIAQSLQIALAGASAGTVRVPSERHPLEIELRLPRELRSSPEDLGMIYVKGLGGNLVPLSELGKWEKSTSDQPLYHKNLHRVVYVFGETAGRPPADCVVDIQADKREESGIGSRESGVGSRESADGSREAGGRGIGGTGDLAKSAVPRPVAGRTFLNNGSGLAWSVPAGVRVDFAGEGEWKITLDVFRDLGLAFGAALVMIYIILVAQTGSFSIPVVVMMAIPLTVLGVMPGFWLLNKITGGQVGGYGDPVFFTATGMIGMIALAGIVTRNSVILVDFIHLGLARGRSLVDAILESCVVRLRPILLTALAAMLSAIPITIDPIFSGLAWALIFGLFASTLFTLFVIPVTYWLVYARGPSGAGGK